MYKNARENYLENAVLSASPQQLRKMLIDGAIRFSRQAIEHWNTKTYDKGLDCVNRVRDIISEILATTKQLDKETLKIREVYVFLLCEVTEASFLNDVEKMQGVIDVLEVEQETWGMVLEQLRNGTQIPNANAAGSVNSAPGAVNRHDPPVTGSAPNSSFPSASPSNGGFSFEA